MVLAGGDGNGGAWRAPRYSVGLAPTVQVCPGHGWEAGGWGWFVVSVQADAAGGRAREAHGELATPAYTLQLNASVSCLRNRHQQ